MALKGIRKHYPRFCLGPTDNQ